MCEICGRYRCAPACPSFVGQNAGLGRIYGVCADCGRIIHIAEKSVRKSERLLCFHCSAPSYEDTPRGNIFNTRFSRIHE